MRGPAHTLFWRVTRWCAPAYLGDLSGLLLHYSLECADDGAGFARLCPCVLLKIVAACGARQTPGQCAGGATITLARLHSAAEHKPHLHHHTVVLDAACPSSSPYAASMPVLVGLDCIPTRSGVQKVQGPHQRRNVIVVKGSFDEVTNVVHRRIVSNRHSHRRSCTTAVCTGCAPFAWTDQQVLKFQSLDCQP